MAAITVTYRGGESAQLWAQALAASQRRAPPGAVQLTAIAVDNASGDGTANSLRQAAPWVKVIEMAYNAGFAAGCNAGIRHAGDVDVVVLINPDVLVHESFLTVLATLDWPADLAARGPLVLSADGQVEQSARSFPRPATALFGRTSLLARLRPDATAVRRELRAVPNAGTSDVDWVSGACLLIASDRLERVGWLDPGYFMYWEDADWCRRAQDAGLRVAYEPALAVTHWQGTSSRSRPVLTTIAFHRSAHRYWRLHAARSRRSVVVAGCLLSARCLVKLASVALSRRRH